MPLKLISSYLCLVISILSCAYVVDHPSPLSPHAQAQLEKGLEELCALSAERRFKLEASKAFHEYMRESHELQEWINDQMQTACSEDYGQDYEHLQVL